MSIMLVLTDPKGTPSLIRWAARLSRTRSQKLTVICVDGDRLDSTAEESGQAETISRTRRAAAEIIESYGDLTIDLLSLGQENLKKALLEKASELASRLVIVGMQDDELSDRLGRQLFNVADFDTILLVPGDGEEQLPDRILVPMAGAFASRAFRLAIEMAEPQSVITPFLVSPEFGVDSRAVARKELKRKLYELGVSASRKIVPQISIDGKATQGIVRAAADCRLVVLGTKDPGTLAKIESMRVQTDMPQQAASPAIALVRPMTGSKESFWGRIAERIKKPIPQLGPTDRINLFDRLQPGVGLNSDFLIMMGLSTTIAAMGLLSDSTAAVIGAMLVAPLMTPLIGAGFGLVQGNSRLFGKAMQSMVLGILTGLVLAFLIGFLMPQEDLTFELMIRSKPDLLDFAVALLSGAAAAYAFARPGLAGTLAGVAIAAALVPPLATVGIAMAQGSAFVAVGAAVLHVTNLVAITIGAAMTFYLLGIQGTRSLIGTLVWARRTTILLVLAAICLLSLLAFKTMSKNVQGQSRPLAFPVSEAVYQAVKERIEKEPGVQLIIIARSGLIEDRNDIYLLLASDRPVNPDFKRDLQQILEEMLGEETEAKIYLVQSATVQDGG